MKNKTAIILAFVITISINNLMGQESPVTGDIVINEIMQNPKSVGDSKGEYFELYNNSSKVIDLNYCLIRDDGSNSHTISKDGGLIINPGDYLILGNNDDTSENGGLIIDYKYSGFTLGNGEDEIILLNESETIIDQVKYTGNNGWPDPDGASMELKIQFRNSTDNDTSENWQVATIVYGDGDMGTPGEANSDNNTDEFEITIQPVDQSLCEGEELLLQIRADGIDSIIYKWKKDGVEIYGESGPDLLFNNSGIGQSGEYQCIISCNGAEYESRIANVEINPLPAPYLGTDSILTSRPDTIILNPGNFLYYLWQDGQTNNTYNVQNSGWHIVEVSDAFCSSKDSVFIKMLVGNKSITINKEINVFPNPAGSTLKVILPTIFENEISISIYSFSGEKISSKKHFTNTNELKLDIEFLKPGNYFIHIQDKNNIQTKKFIKL